MDAINSRKCASVLQRVRAALCSFGWRFGYSFFGVYEDCFGVFSTIDGGKSWCSSWVCHGILRFRLQWDTWMCPANFAVSRLLTRAAMALKLRMGFWGPLYDNCNKEVGSYLGPYINMQCSRGRCCPCSARVTKVKVKATLPGLVSEGPGAGFRVLGFFEGFLLESTYKGTIRLVRSRVQGVRV